MTLEDEENYDNTSVEIEFNATDRNIKATLVRDKEATDYQSNSVAKVGSATSAQRFGRNQVETSNDEAKKKAQTPRRWNSQVLTL
ncbi:hypothetical protein L1049_006483 [Liquidambar formosana]|uniref:Uncharacterized protein n=1 Tax=Liquidambar formosana TaxID=63359 RepID=A0AAP0RFK9_LIQFO